MRSPIPAQIKRESRNLLGRTKAGKLNPVMCQAFEPGEGGMLSVDINAELDPVAGRMITPITLAVHSVAVPVQAIHGFMHSLGAEAATAYVTEVIRQKMLSGVNLFPLESQSDVTRRCGVHPRTITGPGEQVSSIIGYAHGAAVNFLRKRLYTYAVQLSPQWAERHAVTPALLSSTVLQRFGGVLDPDPHINGNVSLSIPEMKLPVEGIGSLAVSGADSIETNQTVRETGTGTEVYAKAARAGWDQIKVRLNAASTNMSNARPDIYADFSGAAAGGVSLVDFYNAETMDRLTREMRKVADENPQDGEEMVVRWAHGLSVDAGKDPWLLYENEVTFGGEYERASDGTGMMDETALTQQARRVSFSVPVPQTELGLLVITFISVKPDETLSAQPHPVLTQAWGARNQVAEQLQLDPVPVTVRDLKSGATEVEAATVAFYTGHNALKRNYQSYGPRPGFDTATVEAKTVMWQYEVPASVTPENIIYPASLDQYPFLDQLAEICTYTCQWDAVIRSPIFFGPTPIETVGVIGDDDLFETEE